MASKSHTSTLAAAYAQAVLELSNERNIAEPIAGELESLKAILADQPTFRQFLDDPAIGVEKRSGVLDRAFQGRIDPLLYNMLRLLNVRGRLGLVGEIADAYRKLLDEQLGRVNVDVTVARQLGEVELRDVKDQISRALRKDAQIKQKVDEDLIGGIVLRIGDRLIDGSVRRQLQMVKEKLLMN